MSVAALGPARRWIGRVEQGLWPLAGAGAYSNRVWLLLVPPVVVAQVLSDVGAHGGTPVAWALAGAAGMLAVWLALAAARLAVRAHGSPRPFTTIGVFGVIGVIGNLVTGYTGVTLGLIPAVDLTYRLVSLGYGTVLLCVIATAVGRHDAHQAVVQDLERKRRRLVALERTMDTQLLAAEAELAGAVRGSLEPSILELDRAISVVDRTGTGPLVAELELLVEREIRPLSHRLMEVDPAPSQLDPTDASGGTVRVPLAPRIPVAACFQPLLLTAGVAAVAAGTAVRDLQPLSAISYLVALTAVSAGLSLAGRVLAAQRMARALPAMILATIGYAIAGLLVLPGLRALGIETPRSLELATAITAALAGLMIAAVPLVEGRRAGTEAERAEVVARLSASVARIRRRQALARRRLAAVLHGSVQGALHAAAVRLSEQSKPEAVHLDRIRADIATAFARLDDEPSELSRLATEATLEALCLVWSGRRRVSADVGPGVVAALARDRDADEAVAEVVQEAINNAVRHGDARLMMLQLRVEPGADPGSAGEVSVRAWNNGLPLPSSPVPGLGTSLYNELCATWSHESDEVGTTLLARVALA